MSIFSANWKDEGNGNRNLMNCCQFYPIPCVLCCHHHARKPNKKERAGVCGREATPCSSPFEHCPVYGLSPATPRGKIIQIYQHTPSSDFVKKNACPCPSTFFPCKGGRMKFDHDEPINIFNSNIKILIGSEKPYVLK